MKNKGLYAIVIGVLMVLVITNPNKNSFLDFLGESEFTNEYRTNNYIICGIYSVDFVTANDTVHIRKGFLGILGKFYEIDKPVVITKKHSVQIISSSPNVSNPK